MSRTITTVDNGNVSTTDVTKKGDPVKVNETPVSNVAAKPATGDAPVETVGASEATNEKNESKETVATSENSESGEISETSESNDQQKSPTESEKKNGIGKRIDKLNARHAKERETLQQEIAHWRAQALKQAQTQSDAQTSSQNAGAPIVQDGRPVEPKPENFATYEELIKAQNEYADKLTDWKIEQREKSQAKKAQQDAYATKLRAFQEKRADFVAKHPDFEEVLADANDANVPDFVRDAILDSENGHALAYHLAKNQDELMRISKMPLAQGLRTLGRIEAQIDSSNTNSQKTKIVPLPDPVTPISGVSSSAVTKDPSKMSFREYRTWRQAHTGR